MEDPCVFCDDNENYPVSYNVFVKKFGDISIVADVSALTIGHLLILTNRHAKSFAQSTDKEFSEALEQIRIIREFLDTRGYELLIAEHGSGSPEDFSPACIDHAHLHLVPFKKEDKDIFKRAINYYDKIKPHSSISTIDELRISYSENSYLYLSLKDEHFVWKAEKAFFHQFFRFALSAAMQNVSSNPMWQMGIDKSKAVATAEFYKNLFGGFDNIRKPNKLVRDKIPDIAVSNGQIPIVTKISRMDFRAELLNKLQEEINEMKSDFSEEEFSDVMEVLSALIKVSGLEFNNVIMAMEKKRSERGGFEQGLKLDYVLDGE